MKFTIEKAERKSVPILMSLSGVSGSGKTFSGLLLAAGIAGGGKVALIDTENNRGSMYADSPSIVKALPQGFLRIPFDPPFSPANYINAVKCAEDNGVSVCVIDSGSHEWEGIGGCEEIAETKKLRGMPNWGLAKMEHKKFVNYLLSTGMHVIVCLRAREKVKMVKSGEKTEVVPLGIQPICEKNFVFEMLVSLRVEEETHHAFALKVPEPLAHLFPGKKLLTKEDGERILLWNSGGKKLGESEKLIQRAKASTLDGVAGYKTFFDGLEKDQRVALKDYHEEFKYMAEQADLARAENEKVAE